MRLRNIAALAGVVVAALAPAGLASNAQADVPKLQIGPSTVKVKNGRFTLKATCLGEAECQSVLTARIDVGNGGLGGKIFEVEGGRTEKLVFVLAPNVRTWLRSHRRSMLVVEARTANEEYEVVWTGIFRLALRA